MYGQKQINDNISEKFLPNDKILESLAMQLEGFNTVLLVETHRRAATGNTKSREVAGALAGTVPSSTARNSVTRPEVLWKTGHAT